jgi:hypothetical protein
MRKGGSEKRERERETKIWKEYMSSFVYLQVPLRNESEPILN